MERNKKDGALCKKLGEKKNEQLWNLKINKTSRYFEGEITASDLAWFHQHRCYNVVLTARRRVGPCRNNWSSLLQNVERQEKLTLVMGCVAKPQLPPSKPPLTSSWRLCWDRRPLRRLDDTHLCDKKLVRRRHDVSGSDSVSRGAATTTSSALRLLPIPELAANATTVGGHSGCRDCNIGQRLHSCFKLDLLKSFRCAMPTGAN
ncbi:hypothetical protein M0804_000089 [Polistes exclamans]|nr:hypothetical protein M0804_000089 [Polistes exclamans]